MTDRPSETAGDAAPRRWLFDKIQVLPDIVRHWAATQPNQVALVGDGAAVTYARLDARSERLANRLVALGLPAAAPVGYIGKNSASFFEIWFGATKAACPLSPFNWRCSVDELVSIVTDANPFVVFATREYAETLDRVRAKAGLVFAMVIIDDAQGLDAFLADVPASRCARVVTSDDVALISYTSGTTGVPKGVMATHQAFAFSFLSGALEPGMAFHEGDVMLMSMPNFHLGASWVSIAALYNGQALSILPAFTPQACLAAIIRDGVTIAPLVPVAIQALLDIPGVQPESFGSLRSIIYFGSPVSPSLMTAAVTTMGCALAQYYGTTETWFLTILRHEDHTSGHEGRFASCGVALPLVCVRIDDGQGGTAAHGKVGEVAVRTPMIFKSYRNRPAETAQVIRDGWYYTGDLGRQDADGFLSIVDRAKDMVITGGENVYSIEVEQALVKLSGVQTCAVVGLPDAKWGERVVAAIVQSHGADLSAHQVVEHCRLHIAGYKLPKQVVFLHAMPLTPTGKVQKAALRRLLSTETIF